MGHFETETTMDATNEKTATPLSALLARVGELEALAEKATPGPWEAGYDNDTGADDSYFVSWYTAGPARCDVGRRYDPVVEEQASNDADFIASSRASVPALCASLRVLAAACADAVDNAKTFQRDALGAYLEGGIAYEHFESALADAAARLAKTGGAT